MAVGFAKVILLGEHAVVYDYRALAAALPCGVSLRAEAGALALEVPQWQLRVEAAASPEHPVAQALQAISRSLAEAAGATAAPAARLCGEASVWAGAGLGSSAAMTVAVARTLAEWAGWSLGDAAIAEAASAGERVFHGTPSGLDVALATGGGAGVFRRGHGLLPMALPAMTLVLGHSGGPRSTAAMVAKVAAATGGDREDARLRGLAEAAELGIAAGADLPALGRQMTRAHRLLGELGVSTPRLDEMCAVAQAAGALGAKLTGAGGGGCAIALVGDRRGAAVEEAWQQLGLSTRVEHLGGGGRPAGA
jgi:mevalonate kinase